jgi:hypothetical protein
MMLTTRASRFRYVYNYNETTVDHIRVISHDFSFYKSMYIVCVFFISIFLYLHAQFDRIKRCVILERRMNHRYIEEEYLLFLNVIFVR